MMKKPLPLFGKCLPCFHKVTAKLQSPVCSMTGAYQIQQNINVCMAYDTNSRKRKNSTLWKYFAISDMLINEIYIGNMVQGKYGSVSYKTKQNKPRPKSEWYIVEGTHEPIIDRELWDRVQALIAQRAKPFDVGTIGLFARKARCANCGYTMRSSKNLTSEVASIIFNALTAM